MGFFDELKSTAKSGADEVKKQVKTTQLQSEIDDLKKKETEAYAEIGRAAVEYDGIEKYGDKGTKLTEVQASIAAKKAELAELRGGAAEGVCPKCGEKYAEGAKFCPKCGERLTE